MLSLKYKASRQCQQFNLYRYIEVYRTMEKNIIGLVLLAIGIEGLTQPNMYRRLMHVPSQNQTNFTISSQTGIVNYARCAIMCQMEGCLSFSYTKHDKRCETYSRAFEEEDGEEDADMSMATMYFSSTALPSSCSDVGPGSPSGVFRIKTIVGSIINLFCDMDTAEGPWTVIQRRTNGDVDFYRNWTDYKNGFGDQQGEFWIGNDLLHLLTNTSRILRFELEAWDGTKGFAQYSRFQVASEYDKYRLSVGDFSGNVSYDAMFDHDGLAFSTPDVDNDVSIYSSCAKHRHGSWWYRYCAHANLNGGYKVDSDVIDYTSMYWRNFPPGREYPPLKTSLMMIR